MRLFLLFAGVISGAVFMAPDGFSQSDASLVQSREVSTLRNALESFASVTRDRMDAMQNELDAFKKCAAIRKIYAPGDDAADANGCVSSGIEGLVGYAVQKPTAQEAQEFRVLTGETNMFGTPTYTTDYNAYCRSKGYLFWAGANSVARVSNPDTTGSTVYNQRISNTSTQYCVGLAK